MEVSHYWSLSIIFLPPFLPPFPFPSLFPGPTVPISSEVTASSNATDSINVIVSLRGCSLHSEPINHQICVSEYSCTVGPGKILEMGLVLNKSIKISILIYCYIL